MNKPIITVRIDYKDETPSIEEFSERIEHVLWFIAKRIILQEKCTEEDLRILNGITILLKDYIKCNQSEIYMFDFDNGGYIRTKVHHPTDETLERHLVVCNPSITSNLDNFGTYQCWQSYSTKKGTNEIVNDETFFYYFEKVS